MIDAAIEDADERSAVEQEHSSASRPRGWCRTSFVCAISLLLMLGARVRAEGFPLAVQLDYLMGIPKSTVNALVNFPWITGSPDSLSGFKRETTKGSLRIVSIETPVQESSDWKHWESDDGAVWIDLVTFAHPAQATTVLRAAGQPHSGYHWANQLLLFSGTGDENREAAGAALIAPTGALLNVGVKLSLSVHPDRPLSAKELAAFDAALERLRTTLTLLAHTFLDPNYVSFSPDVIPKPEALTLVRMTGFARLWSYVKYNFVFIDQRPELNWDAVLDQYMPRIAAAKDDTEYGLLLQQAVALLKDGHSNVYPIAAGPMDSPPLILEPIEGKPVATVVGNVPELSKLRPGMELLEIDGIPVETIIARDIDPYISSSTIQDRQLQRSRRLLQGQPGTHVQTTWRSPDGKFVQLALTRNRTTKREAFKPPSQERFQFKELSGHIAYIGLNDFSSPEIVASFESNLGRLLEEKAWIIDLRRNGGGSSDIGYRILAHFIDAATESSTWRTREYKPSFEAWGEPQTFYEGHPEKIEPAAGPRYEGPIYVLTSPSTCSAAEDFLIPLKMSKRITIVGEPTCGSTGQPLQFSIYGALARVCTKWDRFPDGTEFVGIGILPDVRSARSVRDIASGRDAVLQEALGLASRIAANSK